MFAELEGILLDPVYSGKGAAGLIDYCRKGRSPRASGSSSCTPAGRRGCSAMTRVFAGPSASRDARRHPRRHGAQATVLLMQKVIAAVPARDDADHVPLIVDQNTQVPSRIRRLIDGTGEDPAPVLAAMARGWKGRGRGARHALQHRAPLRPRDPGGTPCRCSTWSPCRSRRRRAGGGGGSVGILASPAVRRMGLSTGRWPRRAHAALCRRRDATLGAIRRIKAQGPTEARARRCGRRPGELWHAAPGCRWSPAPSSR